MLVDDESIGAVGTYTFENITEAHTIYAIFAINTYTITPTAGDNGSISPSDVVTVEHGSSQTFTITPNANYHIVDVSVDNESIGVASEYTFTNVTKNHTISATFAIDTYAITVTTGDNGSISPSGVVTVNHGDSQIFTITPNTNYHIADVLVDDESVGVEATYTFTNVTADHTIHATFLSARRSVAPLGETKLEGTLVINNNAPYTNSQKVFLDISVAGADEMIISNFANFPNVSWEPYSESKEWILSSGDGVKTVYSMFRNKLGGISPVITNSIILDTKPVIIFPKEEKIPLAPPLIKGEEEVPGITKVPVVPGVPEIEEKVEIPIEEKIPLIPPLEKGEEKVEAPKDIPRKKIISPEKKVEIEVEQDTTKRGQSLHAGELPAKFLPNIDTKISTGLLSDPQQVVVLDAQTKTCRADIELEKPIEIKLSYNKEEVKKNDIDLRRLVVTRYDMSIQEWIDMSPVLEPDKGIISTSTNKLGTYTVQVKKNVNKWSKDKNLQLSIPKDTTDPNIYLQGNILPQEFVPRLPYAFRGYLGKVYQMTTLNGVTQEQKNRGILNKEVEVTLRYDKDFVTSHAISQKRLMFVRYDPLSRLWKKVKDFELYYFQGFLKAKIKELGVYAVMVIK